MSAPRNAVSFLLDYERDPAKAVRRQLEQVWAQAEQQAETTAKAKREDELVRGYAQRREPNNPEAA